MENNTLMNQERLTQDKLSQICRQIRRSRSDAREQTLYINVYALKDFSSCTDFCKPIGLGIYHTALQIGEYEVAYGGNTAISDTGIYVTRP